MSFTRQDLAALACSVFIASSSITTFPAFAQSESGGFIFGAGSESGGPMGVGESEATPETWGGGSESGGVRGLGNNNEATPEPWGGVSSESGGVMGTGASSESTFANSYFPGGTYTPSGKWGDSASSESGGEVRAGSSSESHYGEPPAMVVKDYNWDDTPKPKK